MLENKENPKLTQEKAKDTNLIFYPQIGLGNIMFNFQEKEIVAVLGAYNDKEIETFKDSSIVRLSYFNVFN